MGAHGPSVSQIQRAQFKSMGATSSKDSEPGGSDIRGGVKLVPTKFGVAESEDGNCDATSTHLLAQLASS